MIFPKVARVLAVLILIFGILGALITFSDSGVMAGAYLVGSLVTFVVTYGLGEIVELLHKINDKQS